MIRDNIIEASENLSRFKLMAVGANCANFPKETIRDHDSTYSQVVSAIWIWYGEKLRHDLDFLTQQGTKEQKKTLRKFYNILRDQRHDGQHADYKRANEAKQWRARVPSKGREPSHPELIEALLTELKEALITAIDIAATVCNDEAKSSRWVQHNAETPESLVTAALSAIGFSNIHQESRDFIVRTLRGNPGYRSAKSSSQKQQIAATVAIGVLLTRLRVPYTQILEDFNLLGDPRSLSLLCAAHSIEAADIELAPERQYPVLNDVWVRISS
jgi:hypothetical protein